MNRLVEKTCMAHADDLAHFHMVAFFDIKVESIAAGIVSRDIDKFRHLRRDGWKHA